MYIRERNDVFKVENICDERIYTVFQNFLLSNLKCSHCFKQKFPRKFCYCPLIF